MHQIKINIIQTQLRQAQFEILLHASMMRRPQLGSDEDIFALNA